MSEIQPDKKTEVFWCISGVCDKEIVKYVTYIKKL